MGKSEEVLLRRSIPDDGHFASSRCFHAATIPSTSSCE
jgi:hypothetical protein